MKKLFRKAPCGHCEAYIDGKVGIGCISCRGTGEVYVEVDPADLLAVTKELELGYYGLVEELKEQLQEMQRALSLPWDAGFNSALGQVQAHLANLESSLDPKKLRELRGIREKAAAWDLALGTNCLVEIKGPKGWTSERLLAQAQAELKTPDKPFAEAQDKPDYEAMCREILGLGLCESCQKIIDSCWQDHSELLEINPSASGGRRTADGQRQEHTPQPTEKPEGKP